MKPSAHPLDAIRHEYLAPTPDRQVDRRFVVHLIDWLLPRLHGHRVLECGVGDQLWTDRLVDRFPEVTSLDGSPELLAVTAARMAGRPTWSGVCALFEAYSPTRPFDLVLMTYVLEHVADPGLVLRRAHDWLCPGGEVVITVPHALSLHRRLAVCMGLQALPDELGPADRRVCHRRVFTWFGLEKLIVEAGFSILERRGFITKLLPNSLLVECTDAQLKGMFDLGLELPIEYSSALCYRVRCR